MAAKSAARGEQPTVWHNLYTIIAAHALTSGLSRDNTPASVCASGSPAGLDNSNPVATNGSSAIASPRPGFAYARPSTPILALGPNPSSEANPPSTASVRWVSKLRLVASVARPSPPTGNRQLEER